MKKWKKWLLGCVAVLVVIFVCLWLCWVVLPLRALRAHDPIVPRHLVIAHRAASYLAPEETTPAYLLAKELGADYLEIDAQRTKDGVLVAFHDDTPKRTTNVAAVFPGREKQTISEFTLAELKQLDAGSWFNREYPDRARPQYAGVKILTVAEVLDIAGEDGKKYPVYIETKSPERHPGFEKELSDLLRARGWLDWEKGALPGVIFQSFYSGSLEKLKEHAPEAPRVYLIVPETIKVEGGWDKLLDTAARLGNGIGPVGYMCWPWKVGDAHRRGLVVHPFTLNEAWMFRTITFFGADGFFTDKCHVLAEYYGRKPAKSPDEILAAHGY